MKVSEEITLPCGLRLPNRLTKAAMAEKLASKSHQPNEKSLKVYGEWADGGWGMIMSGNVQVSEAYLGDAKDVSTAPKTTQEIWKTWAATCQRSGTPAIIQLNHPGRQSPVGAGNRGFFAKTVAPSAVKLNFGDNLIARTAVSLVFGTPREMTVEEISGAEGVINQFVAGAKQCFDAGFKGVELHAAHGYLLAQFMSPQTNLRTDQYGGTAAKRIEIVLQILRKVREATSKEFCIGIKLNSVDASSSESPADTMEQIQLIIDAGIDFIEISGGTYEDTVMFQESATLDTHYTKQSTLQRESFFIEFAKAVRERFPTVVLMVTGGFRTRQGMEAALESGACDLIGIGRPASVVPALPKNIILNTKDVADEDATLTLAPLKVPFWMNAVPIRPLGASYQDKYYGGQIGRIARGQKPIDNRIQK